jgi:hypothetical protein
MAKATKKTAEEQAMAKNEKHNDGSMSGLKKTIIGTVSTLVVGGGTFLMSYLQKPKEGDTKTPSTPNQQSININIPQQQQSAGNKTVIINKGGEGKTAEPAKPAQTTPAKPKKEGDEFKEKPAQW